MCREAEFSDHPERVVKPSAHPQLFAFTDPYPYHAFKVSDKPVDGVQVHPDVDHHDLAARLTHYSDQYLEVDTALQHILDNLQPTPESNRLIQKFVDRILLGKS